MNRKIPVLCYHNIVSLEEYTKLSDDDKKFVIDVESFSKQMKFLKLFKYKTLTLDEFYNWKKHNKKMPLKSILITFDDGYKNVYKYAMPILKKYNLKACVFIIGNTLEEDNEYISYGDIEDCKLRYSNIEFASHSYSLHTRGSVESLNKKELVEELKKYENVMGKCKYFAYPFGHYTNDMISALKKYNYNLAFLFEMPRKARISDDDYLIPRVNTSFSQSVLRFALKILLPIY